LLARVADAHRAHRDRNRRVLMARIVVKSLRGNKN
jgi:hypothetical protein